MGEALRADFDRIARLPSLGFDHNAHYHDWLLQQLPARLDAALDVGCGTGEFSRRLSERADRVVGIDVSPEMVRIARQRSRGMPGVRYDVADVRQYPLGEAGFDCVASIATLHHLSEAEILPRLAGALRPGGTLLVLDLWAITGPTDWLTSCLAAPLSRILRRLHTGGWREDPAVSAAWTAHASNDRYLDLGQARALCRRVLPGARVRRHLFWRYSLVWRKPSDMILA